jgi:hypothetical protein
MTNHYFYIQTSQKLPQIGLLLSCVKRRVESCAKSSQDGYDSNLKISECQFFGGEKKKMSKIVLLSKNTFLKLTNWSNKLERLSVASLSSLV